LLLILLSLLLLLLLMLLLALLLLMRHHFVAFGRVADYVNKVFVHWPHFVFIGALIVFKTEISFY
jgi:hypothetical protein